MRRVRMEETQSYTCTENKPQVLGYPTRGVGRVNTEHYYPYWLNPNELNCQLCSISAGLLAIVGSLHFYLVSCPASPVWSAFKFERMTWNVGCIFWLLCEIHHIEGYGEHGQKGIYRSHGGWSQYSAFVLLSWIDGLAFEITTRPRNGYPGI